MGHNMAKLRFDLSKLATPEAIKLEILAFLAENPGAKSVVTVVQEAGKASGFSVRQSHPLVDTENQEAHAAKIAEYLAGFVKPGAGAAYRIATLEIP
jgi:hypothetical protein